MFSWFDILDVVITNCILDIVITNYDSALGNLIEWLFKSRIIYNNSNFQFIMNIFK